MTNQIIQFVQDEQATQNVSNDFTNNSFTIGGPIPQLLAAADTTS